MSESKEIEAAKDGIGAESPDRRVVIVSIPFAPLLGIQEGIGIGPKFTLPSPEGVRQMEIPASEEGFRQMWEFLEARVAEYNERLQALEPLSEALDGIPEAESAPRSVAKAGPVSVGNVVRLPNWKRPKER